LYGRHHDLVERYGISVSQMTADMFHLSLALPGPFLIPSHGGDRKTFEVIGILGSVASLLAARKTFEVITST
jgi:hypothetical protein